MSEQEWVNQVKVIRDGLIALHGDKDFSGFVNTHLKEYSSHTFGVILDSEIVFRDLWARIELHGAESEKK